MKKVEITLSFDEEKLEALEFVLRKEKTTVKKKLDEALATLYEQTVPEAVREYLDSRCRPAAVRPRPRRPSRGSQAAHPPHSETVESGQDFGPEVQA